MTGMHALEAVEVEGHSGLVLRSPAGLSARFVPSAGMVCDSLTLDGTELLARGDGLAGYVGRGALCGIPLLHPWANRLSGDGFGFDGVTVPLPGGDGPVRRDPNGLPIHGLLAGCPDWRVTDSGADAGAARIAATLDFAADPGRSACFPFPHRLHVEASLVDASLAITTTLEATGPRPVPVAFGWHPYFVLPGVPRREWVVGLPVRRQCELDARCLPTGAHRDVAIAPGPLAERTFDDLFDRLVPGAPFVLSGGGRRIEVHYGEGYDVAVVYAPGHADLVCFEPMTARTDPFSGGPLRTVAPGEAFSAAFEIRVAVEA